MIVNELIVNGRCHCGNLEFRFHRPESETQIRLRACDCRFCRRHGTKCFSDPAASAVIEVADRRLLQRYRFGTGGTDFLICRTCGCYLGALVSEGGRHWSTLNFRLSDWHDRPAQPVSYGDETPASRLLRRKARFTPTELIIHC